jgi:ADP-heptose:LPS heptosyltransferase
MGRMVKGDIIHMSHLPRLLKDVGFDVVDVETNFKGYQLLSHNPFIDNITAIEPERLFKGRTWLLEKHWTLQREKYDHFINLYGSLEYGMLAMEGTPEYYMHQEVRNNRYAGKNYYDETTTLAGYPFLVGKYKGEVFYKDEEHTIVKDWLKQFDGKFIVLVNLSGTGPHKRLVQAKEIVEEILAKYDDAQVILTGSKDCKIWEFESDRVVSICGKFPFRQALLIANYVDLVIGCESGLMVGAAMWQTPTLMLMTAADIVSHNKYNQRDLSIQSPARCSPCYKGPYQYQGCPHKNGNPLCVYFDIEKIMEKVDFAYDRSFASA